MRIFTVLIFIISSLSFTLIHSTKEIPAPPNTTKIVDNFFFDKTEITNLFWREYISWLEKNHGKEALEVQAAMPNTNVWTISNSHNVPFKEHYFSHPSYNDYPVVGISHKQAKDYCKWRTARVKEMWAENFGADAVPNLNFRLPTKTEWEVVANSSNEVTRKKMRKYAKKHINPTFYNFSRNAKEPSHYSAPVRSYLPNKFGIYHLFGNVAEMVEEEGIAKGGSFMHQKAEAMEGKDFKYDQPMLWLGFRCVCEILEK